MDNPQQSPVYEAANAPLDAKAITGVMQRRWLLAVIVFAAVVGATVGATWTQTPVYMAETQLLVNTAKPQRFLPTEAIPALEDIMGIEPRDVETQRHMLENPDLVLRAAEKLDLTDQLPTLPIGIRVGTAKDSEIISLQVSDVDPQRAAALANAIADAHVESVQSGSQNTARRAGVFIRKQLADMGEQLADTKDKVRDFKLEHGVADLDAELASRTSSLADLDKQAAQAAAEGAGARNTAGTYAKELNGQDPTYTASKTTSRNPLRESLTAKLADLEAQRASMATTRGPDHTDILKLDEEIAVCRDELAKTEETVVSGTVDSANPLHEDYTKSLAAAQAAATAASARAKALRANADIQAERLAEIPTLEAKLGLLEQDAKVAEEMYAGLLQQYQQVQIQEAMTPPIVEVISPAREPLAPVKPRKMLNLAIGLVLGLILAAMAVGAAEALDDRIRTSWQAQATLGLPSLGVVPRVPRGQELLTAENASPAVADVFSALRANLRHVSPEGMPRTIMVTSPRAGDGKTTTAINLAAAIADSSLRTVLVCADLRHPDTHTKAGAAGDQGLTDVLVGQSDLRTCLQASRGSNLWVLPPGTPAPNPVDLIDSDKMRSTLETLQGQFDAVIVDSPSCDQYSDAMLLAPMCGSVLPVVMIGSTPMRVAQGAIDKLSRTGCHILGLLSNGVKMRGR